MKRTVIDHDMGGLEPIILSSENIILEPVNLSELNSFHEYSMCSEIYEYLEFSPFQSISETRTYLQKLIDRSKSPLAQYWFVRAKEYDKVIGSFGMHSLKEFRGSVEIGYGISPYYWGNGYFNEAAKLVIEYIFNNLDLHRVVARTSTSNKASIRGLEKLGFLTEGIMRDYYRRVNGQWFDAVLMAKLNSDR
jgi:ribosomal-protein-alanine N-acetyltransferase